MCPSSGETHRMTSTKCRIDTVVSYDDGHIVGRNMSRKEINILRKIVHPVGFIYKIIYWMHGQTNIIKIHKIIIINRV
jgi:hypothetical protein